MKARQQGLTTVEFAIVGLVLMIVLFTVIEFSRAMWVMNVLEESTRRAARVATVCPVGHGLAKSVGIFAGPGGSSSIVNSLTPDNIQIDYLDEGGTVLANPGASDFLKIRYVRARLVNFSHRLIIPVFGFSLAMPPFDAVVPRESLGITREDAPGVSPTSCGPDPLV